VKKKNPPLEPIIETKVYTHTVTTHSIELTADMILKLLGLTASSAIVCFNVPGGADWSNCSFDIDAENPVVVTWKEEKHE
jgi:hypothetical protein